MNEILTWQDLSQFEIEDLDRVNGTNNSYSNLRLFGFSEKDILVTLYRDRHSWCPYCQKVWLWLEFKKFLTSQKNKYVLLRSKRKLVS